MSLQDEDDDITEPIAPCTSLTPSLPREPAVHQNGGGGGLDSSSMTELPTSEIPEGISCQPVDTAGPAPTGGIQSSIIDQEGYSLEEFILFVRNKTRNGLFDEYQEIKSRPPDGTFDHARMTENLVKVNWIFCTEFELQANSVFLRTGIQTSCATTTLGSSWPGMITTRSLTTSMPTMWTVTSRRTHSSRCRVRCPGHSPTLGRWCGSCRCW